MEKEFDFSIFLKVVNLKLGPNLWNALQNKMSTLYFEFMILKIVLKPEIFMN